MPVNLSSFCISSRFLGNKDIPTTYHIICVCKIVLSQGRFTLCHNSALRSFIKNIKSTAPSSKQAVKIKFVKKEIRVKNNHSFPSAILFHASNWVLLGDLDGTFSFPPHVAFPKVRHNYFF